jgi:hypothetical protein
MNILSIDIDFITSNYGHIVIGDDFNPKHKWENIIENLNGDESILQIDYDNLSFLMSVYIKALNNSKKIIFAINHHTILQELEKENYNNLNIINIDHHHDIFYGDVESLEFFEKYNNVNCGNWIWKLELSNKISSYHWIKNETSDIFNDGISRGKTPKNYKSFLKHNIEYDIYNLTYDLLFITLSPDYIAPKHWFYYDMMMKMYEEKTGEKVQFIQNIPEIRSDKLSSCSDIFDYRLK